jgi:hypothetical protein
MNKIIIAVLCIWCVLFSATAYAGQTTSCPEGYKATTTKHGHQHCYIDTDTDTDTDTLGEPQDEAGVGADVILWQNDSLEPFIEEVTAEYRRDLDNDTNEIYGVVRINLWQKLKGAKKDRAVETALNEAESAK